MNNKIKIKIVIGIVILFLLGNFSAVGLTQINTTNNSEIAHPDKPLTNPNGYPYGWPQIFDGRSDDEGWGLTIDSQNNVIATGYSVDRQTGISNILTIKYNNDGDELWNASYNTGINDIAFDVTTDSEDNIIIIGFSGSNNNWNGSIIVIKYNTDGLEQWSKVYRKGISNFPGGIITDSNDNIIITVSIGDINQINVSSWTIKMDPDGNELWNKIFRESWSDFSLGITIGLQDNIIVVGISISPIIGGGFSIINYDNDGNVLWWRSYDGNQAWDVAIDSMGNIIIVGDSYSYEYDYTNWYIIKCNNNGEVLWTREYDSGESDSAMGVAIDSQDNVIVSGHSCFNNYQKYEHCLIIYDQNGEELCMRRPEIKGTLMDVEVDNRNTIFVTGSKRTFLMGTSDFYTDKYFDIIPPSAQMIKPVENCLYLLNFQLFSLPKNTIIIGPLTISVDIENPSDVTKVEFYIDNEIMETINKPPYEWTWNDRGFGKHIIKTMTYDALGNVFREEISLIKLV